MIMRRKFFSHTDLDGTRLQVGTLNSTSAVTVGFSMPGEDTLIVRLSPDKIDELIACLSHAREVLEVNTVREDSLLFQ